MRRMHADRSEKQADASHEERNQVSANDGSCLPPAIDLCWEDYEDLSLAARMESIDYPVLVDPRICTLLERMPSDYQLLRYSRHEKLATYALVGLRFLLDRFPNETRFRYSIGPGPEESKLPVIVSFHRETERGYFWAITLDFYGTELNA